MPQPIHQLAITNDDWHHVSRRCPGIESELAKLRMEVICVFPKFRAQLRLARPELQRFENCGDHDRWQRARVHVRMRVKTQILKRLLRTGDETAQRSERFRKRAVHERKPVFNAEVLSSSPTVRTAREHRMRFVNEDARAVSIRHINHLPYIS